MSDEKDTTTDTTTDILTDITYDTIDIYPRRNIGGKRTIIGKTQVRRKKSDIWDAVLACLRDRPHTRHELHNKTGISINALRNALEDMAELKLVTAQAHNFRCKDHRNRLGYTKRTFWHILDTRGD